MEFVSQLGLLLHVRRSSGDATHQHKLSVEAARILWEKMLSAILPSIKQIVHLNLEMFWAMGPSIGKYYYSYIKILSQIRSLDTVS